MSPEGATAPLSARLKAATRPAHVRAERAGAMALLLRGALDGACYARLLRALQLLYEPLERALRRHAAHPAIAPLEAATLCRADALAHDLAALRAAGHVDARPAPPAAALAYAARLARLDRADPVRLVAHAYVRYLGDLAGGQVLAPLVERAYGLEPGMATRFYAFGPRAAANARAGALRAALDALPLAPREADAIVEEALDAFERHVELFEEIAADATPRTVGPAAGAAVGPMVELTVEPAVGPAAGPPCRDGDALAQRPPAASPAAPAAPAPPVPPAASPQPASRTRR